MKKRKLLTRILDKLFLSYSFVLLLLSIFGSFYLYFSYRSLSSPTLVKNPEVYASEIYDANDNVIQKIGKNQGNISYEDLPKTLLDAIVAVEDNNYYRHDGVDIHRVFGSIFHNLTSSSSLQGASTLTQQLARNLFLSSEKTLQRKIKELLLSFSLESTYEKETILEFYFNRVNFDPVYPGIVYAADKFFNKDVSALTMVESATLVGLVQSPSAYEPFRHPDRANERKNVVLKKMLDLNFISESEYKHGINLHVADLLYTEPQNEDTLPYQAYIDAVYQETVRLIGCDPYQEDLKIYTYMEPSLQEVADKIQNDENGYFKDDVQQIGGALIEQETGKVVALIGGRNYAGRRLFNRAYDKKVNPASTIKPVFEYLLAVEKLGYHRAKTLEDEETTYLNGEPLKNAGGHYSGLITFQDALGYSKNTTAIRALNELTRKYGEDYLEEYLRSIGLMDKGPYTESYGLGGMTEGISLANLAAAYCVIAGDGQYISPGYIKRIEDQSGKVLYIDNREKQKIVSKESSYIMKEMLVNLVDNGYNGLERVKLNGIKVGAKTGTGQYAKETAKKYGYPTSADKDSLVVGFSPDYTLAIWTGFDKPEKDEKAYFGSGDSRRQVSKYIFKELLKKAANSHLSFNKPNTLFTTNVVKYADDLYSPNIYIPSSYQMMTTITGNMVLPEYPLPTSIMPEGNILEYTDRVEILMNNKLQGDKVYEKIYGKLGYHILIDDEKIFSSEPSITLYRDVEKISKIKITIGYEELDYSNESMQFDMSNTFNFWQ